MNLELLLLVVTSWLVVVVEAQTCPESKPTNFGRCEAPADSSSPFLCVYGEICCGESCIPETTCQCLLGLWLCSNQDYTDPCDEVCPHTKPAFGDDCDVDPRFVCPYDQGSCTTIADSDSNSGYAVGCSCKRGKFDCRGLCSDAISDCPELPALVSPPCEFSPVKSCNYGERCCPGQQGCNIPAVTCICASGLVCSDATLSCPTPAPTTEPSEAPTFTPNTSGFFGCFSGISKVNVRDKGIINMKDLQIGDSVQVANNNKYEPVYSFGHKEPESLAEFLLLETSHGKTLAITAQHMIMVPGSSRFVPASSLKEGDVVITALGNQVTVKSIVKAASLGVYAPFTPSGQIIVDDLVASTYIAYQESEFLQIGPWKTPVSHQWLAHTATSVHRLAVQSGWNSESYTDWGISHWVHVPHEFGRWLFKQNALVVGVVMIPVVVVCGVLYVVEAIVKMTL